MSCSRARFAACALAAFALPAAAYFATPELGHMMPQSALAKAQNAGANPVIWEQRLGTNETLKTKWYLGLCAGAEGVAERTMVPQGVATNKAWTTNWFDATRYPLPPKKQEIKDLTDKALEAFAATPEPKAARRVKYGRLGMWSEPGVDMTQKAWGTGTNWAPLAQTGMVWPDVGDLDFSTLYPSNAVMGSNRTHSAGTLLGSAWSEAGMWDVVGLDQVSMSESSNCWDRTAAEIVEETGVADAALAARNYGSRVLTMQTTSATAAILAKADAIPFRTREEGYWDGEWHEEIGRFDVETREWSWYKYGYGEAELTSFIGVSNTTHVAVTIELEFDEGEDETCWTNRQHTAQAGSRYGRNAGVQYWEWPDALKQEMPSLKDVVIGGVVVSNDESYTYVKYKRVERWRWDESMGVANTKASVSVAATAWARAEKSMDAGVDANAVSSGMEGIGDYFGEAKVCAIGRTQGWYSDDGEVVGGSNEWAVVVSSHASAASLDEKLRTYHAGIADRVNAMSDDGRYVKKKVTCGETVKISADMSGGTHGLAIFRIQTSTWRAIMDGGGSWQDELDWSQPTTPVAVLEMPTSPSFGNLTIDWTGDGTEENAYRVSEGECSAVGRVKFNFKAVKRQ